MGTSSNGTLVFGIDMGEEWPEFLEDYEGNFDDYLEGVSGLPKWGEPGHEFQAQWAYRDSCPADIVLYCSYECPMYILAVRGTETTVHRGYVEEINSLAVDEDRLIAFKAWCVERGIENPEPKWLLASMYG